MRIINLIIFAAVLFLILGALTVLFLRLLNPEWWKNKVWRATVILLPIMGIAAILIWATGSRYEMPLIARIGSVMMPAAFILELALLISLTLSGLVFSIGRISGYIESKIISGKESFSGGRRRLFKVLGAVFPAVIIPGGLAGVSNSYGSINVAVKKIPVARLPEPLRGFKIAHLSDMHLGYYVQLDDLERAVELVAEHKPDLVLVTGDISDDLDILPQALELINRLKPKFGIFASVGNHEYYRGIEKVLEIFKTSPFPILINQAVAIDVDDYTLYLGGADDPVHLRRDNSEFLKNSIQKTLGHIGPESFRLLMCHRPEGFDYSAEAGIDLVLAGHTHGGQVGVGGRSLLESILPEKYLWGIYRRGSTTLFTTSGMGHWFPFRLGCPAEAPILVLEES